MMGASQSKKKRKEKRKRKRSFPISEIQRSASVDVIRTMNVSSSSALSPSLSWSESVGVGWGPSSRRHHRCLHSQYEDIRAGGGAGFESCPNCYSSTTDSSQPVHRPPPPPDDCSPQPSPGTSMPEGHGHSDGSTVFLNREFGFHQQNFTRTARTAPAAGGDCEFEFSHLLEMTEMTERQKDRSVPLVASPSSCEGVGIKPSLPQQQQQRQQQQQPPPPPPITPPPPQSQTSAAAINASTATIISQSLAFNNSPHSPPPPPPPPPPPSSSSSWSLQEQLAAENQAASKDSKISLLEDEETKVSRWIKRKQMAQQLRDLRRHLENSDSTSASLLPVPLLAAGNESCVIGEDNDFLSFGHSSDQLAGDAAMLQNDGVPTDPSSADACSSASSPTRRIPRSKFSRMSNYRYLDNHPVLTRLQNEQNNRLETMEKRMKEIRISAMQEAERRKFAEIFPAKNDESETQRMLAEAKETLEKLKEEKRRKMQYLQGQQQQSPQGHQEQSEQTISDDDRGNNSSVLQDSGEIIPVCVVPHRDIKSSFSKFRGIIGRSERAKEVDKKQKPFWLKSDWPEINLNQPLTWLLLPFLLFPLILRMLLSLIINTNTPAALSERGSGSHVGSSSSTNSSDDTGRRRSSDGHAVLARLGSKKLN